MKFEVRGTGCHGVCLAVLFLDALGGSATITGSGILFTFSDITMSDCDIQSTSYESYDHKTLTVLTRKYKPPCPVF